MPNLATGRPVPSPQLDRWQRLQLQVRCALAPAQPTRIRLYLMAGLHLVRLGQLPTEHVHARMLQTPLHTAEDTALPWFWRSVCLEHVPLPLAHLVSRLGTHDAPALRTIEAAVQRAHDHLAMPPRPTGIRSR